MSPDTLTQEERSERMRRVKGRDTKPELLIRRLLHRNGFRYRLQAKELPGTPDIVFRRQHKAIFIHGCFWHRHSNCKLARIPKSRTEFWTDKLESNRLRDAKNQEHLRQLGWDFEIVWECEMSDLGKVLERLRKFLKNQETVVLQQNDALG